jgi:hypothetical protein
MTTGRYIFAHAFPGSLQGEIDEILKVTSIASEEKSQDFFCANVQGVNVLIPERIYAVHPQLDIALSERQQTIVACYFTRHHNGFVREQSLRSVMNYAESWVAPYVVRLTGEYVLEILLFIQSQLSNLDKDLYSEFLRQNPAFYQLIRRRVVSYWDCYYRKDPASSGNLKHPGYFPKWSDYPGSKVLKFFDALL